MKEFNSTVRTKPIKHLVIHSFALSPKEMLDALSDYDLSVHYMIDACGTVRQLVPEEKVAWHAGSSFWNGETGLNWTSVGIELEHLEYGQTDFPEIQINALSKLSKEIIKRHKIRPENVVGHGDIAPLTKADPGRGFPWKKLAEQGVGIWYDLTNANKMSNMTVTDALALIGYPTEGLALEAASWAFRQRFMPEVVPIDPKIAEREKEVFKARQQASRLSPEKQEQFLLDAPTIYPPNDGTYLTDPDFIQVLKAVAYQYQKARNT